MEQRRFLLAMILSGLVIFLWQVFLVPPPDPDLEEITTEELAEQVDEEIDDEAVVDEADPAEVEEAEPTDVEEIDEEALAEAMADDEEVDVEAAPIEARVDVMQAQNLRVELSNRGGVVRDARVTAPEQYAGIGGQMMRAFEEEHVPDWPYSLVFEGQMIDVASDQMYELVADESEFAADGESFERIVYRYEEPRGRYVIDKIYTVDDERRYVVNLEVRIENHLDDVPLIDRMSLDITGRDDPDKDAPFFDFRPDVLEGVCHTTDDTERDNHDGLDGLVEYTGHNVLWAGADTRYFMMAAAPVEGAESCSFERAGEEGDYLRTRITHANFSIPSGDSLSTRYTLFMGPKDFDVLRETGHEFQEAVDYGLFTILARPLRFLLVRAYNLVHNWGLAIILLTLLIKALTWRITGKAYENAERMKQIQPVIKEIREKYENDQQRMTEETMKAFKENNVSPLGCLPLLLQMPILYGLFVMIYNSVELYHAQFLWYADLSAPDPWFILPVVMGGVMFIQQRLTMSTAATTNPQMMMVMKIMPVAFTAFMLFLPAGLVLYYLLNLLIGLAQQFLIKRKFRLAEEAGEEA